MEFPPRAVPGSAVTVAAKNDHSACTACREDEAAAEWMPLEDDPPWCAIAESALWMTRSKAVPEALQSAMVELLLMFVCAA